MWVDANGAYVATQYNQTGNSHQWTFDNTGNLTLPANTSSINYANGQPYGGSDSAAGNAGDIQINVAGNIGADSTLRYVDNGGEMTLYADYLNAPGIFTSDIYAGDGTPSNITLTTSYGNAAWTFSVDGNLSVPGGGAVWTLGPGTAGLTANIADPYQVNLGLDYTANTATLAGNSGVYLQTNSGNSQWAFLANATMTLPGGSRLRPLGANLDIFAGTGSYVNLITSDESTAVGVDGGGGYITTAGGTWDFDTTGNLTVPGNIIMTTGIVGSGASPAPYLSGFSSVSAVTLSASGNVTAANFFGNGNTLSNIATQVTGSWDVPVGNSTQSFTVNSGTYSMWVDCNIPNGILAWNATATVTNNNVPVVGAQYAWVYNGGGTPVDFTSIPNQFIGTANTIVRSSTAPSSTTNRFDFGINNTSGGNVTVRYGYTKL
jgi:hypothetical protein